MTLLSIIVPVYYNQETLEELHRQFLAQLDLLGSDFALEMVFVDDGSQDRSRDVLREIASGDDRVKVICLARNFGSFTAIRAGLRYSTGDAAVIISADLQDPPTLIPEMVARWQAGEQTVMATRESRGDPWLSRQFSNLAYGLIRRWALPTLPPGGFDFVLVDRKVIDTINAFRERNTTLMGLIVWVGYRQVSIPYHRSERERGSSRWTFWKKFKYLLDSLLAFSYVPIRAVSGLGIFLGLGGLAYAAILIVLRLTRGFDAPGWTALMVVVLILFGFQFFALGAIGEYLWRALDEARVRPLFHVQETIGVDAPEQDA